MKFQHTNLTSLERYCCYHEQFIVNFPKELTSLEKLFNVTKVCFSDLNITFDQQEDVILNWIVHPYDTQLCEAPELGPCNEATTPSHIGYMCFWMLILLITVSSNFLVITAVHKVSYLREVAGNFLISSLAASDMLVGLFLIPIKMTFAYHNLSFCSLHLCRFFVSVDVALFSTSITNLFFISIDRYMALNFPFKHRNWLTLVRCKFLIGGIWLYGLMWAVLCNINWRHPYKPSVHIRIEQCLIDNDIYIVTMNILVFYIPAVTIAIVYYRVLRIARHHARAISESIIFQNNNVLEKTESATATMTATIQSNGVPPSFSDITSSKESGSSDHSIDKDSNMNEIDMRSSKSMQTMKYRKMSWKASKTVATVYFTFFFCWFPVMALSLALAFCRECFNEYRLKWFYLIFVEVIPIVHSMMNPFIYGFMNKQYRRAYRRIFAELKAYSKLKLTGKKEKADKYHPATVTK